MEGIETFFSIDPNGASLRVFVHSGLHGLPSEEKEKARIAIEEWLGESLEWRLYFLDPPGCIH